MFFLYIFRQNDWQHDTYKKLIFIRKCTPVTFRINLKFLADSTEKKVSSAMCVASVASRRVTSRMVRINKHNKYYFLWCKLLVQKCDNINFSCGQWNVNSCTTKAYATHSDAMMVHSKTLKLCYVSFIRIWVFKYIYT